MDCKIANPLIGPVSLYILEKKGSKIVLLGDYHTKQPTCTSVSSCGESIHEYLQKLFNNYKGSEPIDLFLEIDFSENVRPVQYDPTKNYVFSVISYFHTCLTRKLRASCLYKNVRFHYADVRGGVFHSGTNKETRDTIFQFRDLHKVWHIDGISKIRLQNIKFIDELLDHYEKLDVDYFFRLAKIDKQLKHIKDPLVTVWVKALMVEHMTNPDIVPLKNKIDTFLFDLLLANESKTWFTINENGLNIYMYLMVLLSPLFDIYTITRILRHNMKQVIVYAGDAHIQRICDFLMQRLGYKETISKLSIHPEKDFQCIDMSDVPQPWFA